jgi:hypothetical protein
MTGASGLGPSAVKPERTGDLRECPMLPGVTNTGDADHPGARWISPSPPHTACFRLAGDSVCLCRGRRECGPRASVLVQNIRPNPGLSLGFGRRLSPASNQLPHLFEKGPPFLNACVVGPLDSSPSVVQGSNIPPQLSNWGKKVTNGGGLRHNPRHKGRFGTPAFPVSVRKEWWARQDSNL